MIRKSILSLCLGMFTLPTRADLVYYTFEGTVDGVWLYPTAGGGYKLEDQTGKHFYSIYEVDFSKPAWQLWADGSYVEPQDTPSEDTFYSNIISFVDYSPENGPGAALVHEARYGSMTTSFFGTTSVMFGGRHNGYGRYATIYGWNPEMGMTDLPVQYSGYGFGEAGQVEMYGYGRLVSISYSNPLIPEPSALGLFGIGTISLLLLRRANSRKRVWIRNHRTPIQV